MDNPSYIHVGCLMPCQNVSLCRRVLKKSDKPRTNINQIFRCFQILKLWNNLKECEFSLDGSNLSPSHRGHRKHIHSFSGTKIMPKLTRKNKSSTISNEQNHSAKTRSKSGLRPQRPQATDRPGFDLGGASTDASAGRGIGFGNNAAEYPKDQRQPGVKADVKQDAPRFTGSVTTEK
ncbi:MAG: hypothetical protein ABI705_08545 [Aestuariivirga sp.]